MRRPASASVREVLLVSYPTSGSPHSASAHRPLSLIRSFKVVSHPRRTADARPQRPAFEIRIPTAEPSYRLLKIVRDFHRGLRDDQAHRRDRRERAPAPRGGRGRGGPASPGRGDGKPPPKSPCDGA